MCVKLNGYDEARDGYYNEGKKVTNFVCRLEGLILDIQTGQRIFRLSVIAGNQCEVLAEISAQDVNTGNWLAKLPVPVWCENPKQFASDFRKALAFSEEYGKIERVSPVTGFQKVDGRWKFLLSNGALTEDGFDKETYSTVRGAVYSGGSACLNEDESMRYLELVCQQARQVYPILAINLLSISRDLFLHWGIDVGLSLWLEGRSGSGKTTLAKVFGMFVESLEKQESSPNTWHRRRLVSATEKIPVVVGTLQKSHGLTVVLDDVKKEKSQRQREKANAVMDIAVRSVYQGYTTEQASKKQKPEETLVGTCAIITGEYRETEESQNARLMIVDVSEFLQDQEKRAMLTEVQEHCQWQTKLLGGFIRWLIKEAGEEGRGEKWRGRMKDLQNREWIYESRPNGQRLKDSRSRFFFVTELLGEFLLEQFPQREKEIRKFLQAAKRSIDDGIQYTFGNLGGFRAIAESVLKEIVDELVEGKHIRRACYKDHPYARYGDSRWEEEQFCFIEEIGKGRKEEALLIPEFRKSLQRADQEGKPVDEGPCFIMLRADFEARLQNVLNRRIQQGDLSEEEGNKITVPLFAKLGFFLAWPRYDGEARYDKPYPRINFWKTIENGDYEWNKNEYDVQLKRESHHGGLSFESAFCFDLKNPIFRGILQDEYSQVDEDIPSFLPGEETAKATKARRAFRCGIIRLG